MPSPRSSNSKSGAISQELRPGLEIILRPPSGNSQSWVLVNSNLSDCYTKATYLPFPKPSSSQQSLNPGRSTWRQLSYGLGPGTSSLGLVKTPGENPQGLGLAGSNTTATFPEAHLLAVIPDTWAQPSVTIPVSTGSNRQGLGLVSSNSNECYTTANYLPSCFCSRGSSSTSICL
eukprot:g37219.t1